MSNNIENRENKHDSSFRNMLNKLKESLWLDQKKEGIETWDNSKSNLNNLEKSTIDSAIDWLENNIKKELLEKEVDMETKDELKDSIDKFFKKWKEEFNDDNDTSSEKNFVKKYKNLENRSIDVAEWIQKSADDIEKEIINWKDEKNPVAKSLLRIVNRIMKSEK